MNILFYSKLKKAEYLIIPDCANYTLIRKGTRSESHIHPVYHVMFIVDGAGYLENNEGKYFLKPKDIIIINPNEKHILSSDQENGMTYFTFNFYLLTPDYYEKFLDNERWDIGQRTGEIIQILFKYAETNRLDIIFPIKLRGKNSVLYDKSKWDEITLSIVNFSGSMEEYYINLINLWKTRASWNQYLCLNSFAKFFWDICCIFSSSNDYPDNIKNDDKLINSIIDFLQNHVEDKYCLYDISACLKYNPTYLCTYFKKHTGMTINQYFNKLKIHKSCMYLKTTSKSITEIAYILNFSSPNHFSRNFKQERNLTPMEYRKQIEI
jgi:AraC-like DNA-binding protein